MTASSIGGLTPLFESNELVVADTTAKETTKSLDLACNFGLAQLGDVASQQKNFIIFHKIFIKNPIAGFRIFNIRIKRFPITNAFITFYLFLPTVR